MKNSFLKKFIVFIAALFFAVGLAGKIINAQAKSSGVKAAKDSVKSTSKTKTAEKTDSPKKNGSSKIKESQSKPSAETQIIVSVTSARVRQEPNAASKVLKFLNIGTILNVSDENSDWFQVKLSDTDKGWISKTIVMKFDNSKRLETYRKIIDKYSKSNDLDFTTASQIADFLRSKNDLPADLKFKRLLALSSALKKIPVGKDDQNPYKSFTESNKKDIVYSEPSAQWLVRSDALWQLHNQSKNLPISEEIAWQAAQTPLPGECEGYVNCYLYNIRATDGEYLNFYPNGKYSKKALQNITSFLEPIVADSREKAIYSAASDISDRAEFNNYLAELRKIISKLSLVEKSKTLKQISQLGEGYR